MADRGDPAPRRGIRQVLAAGASRLAALGSLAPSGIGAPVDLRLAGRVLFHSALVGLAAGLIGAAFFAGLELGQRVLLEGLAGFVPLRAAGEEVVASGGEARFLPWVLVLLPALGGLGSGLLTWRFARETAGGGGDAAIEAYHHGGVVRRRVIPVKALAAFCALSTGGSGGREGPTMQIGAAVGSAVARLLPTTRTERRVLLVAGVAAGIAAVFRTPLGAALLATEVLYRDDFEAEALVPSIFASVVSYSVVIAIFGESRLFGVLPRFPFTLRHLPLYALSAVVVCFAAVVFIRLLRAVQRRAERLPGPPWLRPAVGGLLMGLVGTGLALWMEHRHGPAARGFGVFGGGYGSLQVAMTGADWLPAGATLVGALVLAAIFKMVAASLTIGSGSAAGDFAPALVIGGFLGSAFGHAARLALGDPTLEPAAFALVGMGTFYGGLAHTPLAALVLVAELAGSYDLLVPMMTAIGIAYVALRGHSLYHAQRASRLPRQEPAAQPAPAPAATRQTAGELALRPEIGPVDEQATLQDVAALAAAATRQRVILVTSAGAPRGLADTAFLADVPAADRAWLRARDAMVPLATVRPEAQPREVAELLQGRGVSQLPVVDGDRLIGWIGQDEVQGAGHPG